MTDGLRMERSALPLAEAAARLGLSAETLRQRIVRGEAQAVIRDGDYFVYVGDAAAERRFGGGTPEPPAEKADIADKSAKAAEPPADGSLPVVVEFQKMELTRLLRENERLNTRLDQLMDEIRHLRDMQQREQVLRQQEQGLRRQIQDTLDHLAGRLALPPPRPASAGDAVSRPASAGEPVSRPAPAVDARHRPTPAGETGSRPASAVRPAPAERPNLAVQPNPNVTPSPPARPTPSDRREARPELILTRRASQGKTPDAAKAGVQRRPGSSAAYLATGRHGQWRREPHTVMPKAGAGRPVTPPLSASPASVENGGIAPEEAAELAVILQDIGQSLRDSEAFRRFPPIKPALAPQRAGDRRAGDGPQAGMAAPPDGRRPAAATANTASNAADPARTEEQAILSILESMGPTIEDRRAAAGRMQRLLRGRTAPRRYEP